MRAGGGAPVDKSGAGCAGMCISGGLIDRRLCTSDIPAYPQPCLNLGNVRAILGIGFGNKTQVGDSGESLMHSLHRPYYYNDYLTAHSSLYKDLRKAQGREGRRFPLNSQ